MFGVHCVAGVIGTLAVGILANPTLGGTGVLDYVAQPGKAIVAQYDTWAQLWAQFKAIVVTLLWSSYVSARLYTLTDMAVGLRPAEARKPKASTSSTTASAPTTSDEPGGAGGSS